MSKLPAFLFYPSDWETDPGLRICSKAAKGLWIDLMCVAFKCEERGKFSTNGKPWTREEVAGAIPGDLNANLTLLDELLAKGVARCDKRRVIFNARMVRDEEIRKVRSKAGSLGGNPNLLNQNTSKTQAKHRGRDKLIPVNANEKEKETKSKKLNSETAWQDSPLFEFQKFREKLADWPVNKVLFYHELFNLSEPGKYRYSDWSLTARRWDKKDPWVNPNGNGQFKATPIEDLEINQEELQKAIANVAAEREMVTDRKKKHGTIQRKT